MHISTMFSVLVGALTFRVIAVPLELEQEQEPPVMKCPLDHTICKAIDHVSNPTNHLNEYLGHDRISYFKAGRVFFKTRKIMKSIKKSIKDTEHSSNMTMTDAIWIMDATNKLVNAVNVTMENLIFHYSDFANMPLSYAPIPFVPHMDTVVYKSLKKQSNLSEQFGAAVVDKLPHDGARLDARARLAVIYASFDKTLEVYEKKD